MKVVFECQEEGMNPALVCVCVCVCVCVRVIEIACKRMREIDCGYVRKRKKDRECVHDSA